VAQQVHRHTLVSQEKKEPLLKGKRQAIQIARTTRNHIGVKVGDNLSLVGMGTALNRGSESLLKTIKKSDGMDLIFLVVFPSPTWPLYFAYRGKIKNWTKRIKIFNDSMEDIEEIRKKAVSEYLWIKRVIESSETPDHIKCCKRLVENWTNSTTARIRDYKCAFYRTSEIKKTIEAYRRSRRELIQQIADKSVILIDQSGIL